MINKKIIIGGSIALIILIAILTWLPNTTIFLRTQVAPELDNDITRTFSWSPTSKSDVGDHTLTVTATDKNGATVTKEIPITVEDQNLAISEVSTSPSDTSATITWQTADEVLSILDFDVTSELRKRVKGSDDTKKQSHSLALNNLLSCTRYRFRISAIGVSETVTDEERFFTTTGCTGNAAINGVAEAEIPRAGGEVEIAGKISIDVPNGAIAQRTSFQIKQLDRDTALSAIGNYNNLSPVTGLYELDAASDPTTQISSFSQPLNVTVNYTPPSEFNATTLVLARYDGSSWQQLTDCTVNESGQSISCPTSQFSAVAGFASGSSSGDEAPEPTPSNNPPSSGGDGDSGGGSGGGSGNGGGGGDNSEPTPDKPKRTYTYPTARDHQISGSYSGIIKEGARTVARLAHPSAVLSKKVQTPADNYYLDVQVKHDKPGPVDMVVYLNNRPWKVIRLDKADNKYRVHRLGQLRNFKGATISFRMRQGTDMFDRTNPIEDNDRNLFIEWWRLTNQNTPLTTQTAPTGTGGGTTRTTRSTGQNLLPNLNSYIEQELGKQHINFPTWQYYAWRLTVPASHPASIGDETELRSVLKFWKGAQPQKPYGEVTK